VLKVLDAEPRPWARDAARDQLVRSALLALSSDWAFMVTKDSAAGYARDRHRRHHLQTHELATLIERGHPDVLRHAVEMRSADRPFGHLDARLLAEKVV
jgi:1,4-alpha-glucan branching enzyme